jgi:hypothetical protein
MLGRDQLYAIEPVIPLSHKQPDPKKKKQITHFPNPKKKKKKSMT